MITEAGAILSNFLAFCLERSSGEGTKTIGHCLKEQLSIVSIILSVVFENLEGQNSFEGGQKSFRGGCSPVPALAESQLRKVSLIIKIELTVWSHFPILSYLSVSSRLPLGIHTTLMPGAGNLPTCLFLRFSLNQIFTQTMLMVRLELAIPRL